MFIHGHSSLGERAVRNCHVLQIIVQIHVICLCEEQNIFNVEYLHIMHIGNRKKKQKIRDKQKSYSDTNLLANYIDRFKSPPPAFEPIFLLYERIVIISAQEM